MFTRNSINFVFNVISFQLSSDSFIHDSIFHCRYNVVAKAIIYYFLPLSIIGVLYALMARRLHLSAREMPGELAGPQSRAQARARRHVARMVVTFVIGKKCEYYLCYFFRLPNEHDEAQGAFTTFTNILLAHIEYSCLFHSISFQFSSFASSHTTFSCCGFI